MLHNGNGWIGRGYILISEDEQDGSPSEQFGFLLYDIFWGDLESKMLGCSVYTLQLELFSPCYWKY